MTLQLTRELEQRLEHLAAQAALTPDELAGEVLDRYLKHIEALTAEVREGKESAVREGWLTHDEVFVRLNQRLLKTS